MVLATECMLELPGKLEEKEKKVVMPRESDWLGLGSGPGMKIFQSSPGDFNVQLRLRLTVLDWETPS